MSKPISLSCNFSNMAIRSIKTGNQTENRNMDQLEIFRHVNIIFFFFDRTKHYKDMTLITTISRCRSLKNKFVRSKKKEERRNAGHGVSKGIMWDMMPLDSS